MVLAYVVAWLLAFALQAASQTTTSGSFFKRVDQDEEQNAHAERPLLNPNFFQCGRAEACSNVVMYKDTNKYQMVHGKAELLKIKRETVTWEKVKKHEPWVVIQRRIDNTTDFYRNWNEYKAGFGNEAGNWWMGLDKIHALAGPGKGAILNVTLKYRWGGDKVFFAQYSLFEVGNETDGYRIRVGGYLGTAKDSLNFHNLMKFTTHDRDNDGSREQNCATTYKGGWWYNSCFWSNLNAWYPPEPMPASAVLQRFMTWYALKESMGDVIFSEMKVKVKQ